MSDGIRIKKITRKTLKEPMQLYDVINAYPFNNFLIKTNSGFIISHNCAMLDEINFSKSPNEDFTKSDIMTLYNSVKRRMESRFMKKGEIPGILFLVSSKKSEHDFLEQYAKTQINNPNTFIIDEPVWNIKPASFYCGKKFTVAIGNKYVKSTIVKDGDDPADYLAQGYRLMDIPIEHREAFELDIDSALMDIANVPVESKSKFIAYERLSKNYNMNRKNPFSMEVLSIGMDDNLEIKDFFKEDMVAEEDKTLSGFIHIDTSLRGDCTGLSYVCIAGTKRVNKYSKTENNISVENATDLIYRQIFTIGIKAPSNSEISFEKTRTFIYYLRSIGFNIRGVSADGFQSADTIQQLKQAGYNAKKISLDRTDEGYMTFKQAINEERLDLLNLKNTVLEREIVDLQREGQKGKVDHPSTGCLIGTTEILTDKGSIPISDLKDNDIIYAFTNNNIVKSNFKNKRITKYVNKLLCIVTEDNRIIKCTENHPILTVTGYIRAEDLKVKDKLKDSVKGNISISKIYTCHYLQNIPVFDIEVPIYNNFILANGLIVHNSKDESDSLCGAIYNASTSKVKEKMIHAEDDAELLVDFLDDIEYSNQDELKQILNLEGTVIDYNDFKQNSSNIIEDDDDIWI